MASKTLTPKQEATQASTTPARLKELAEMSVDLAKIVAKNLNTSPDDLKELGSHSDVAIRKNVVQNPNTPTEVLLKLAGQFPEQFLDNPVFDLLLLEHPDLLTNLSESAMRSILKRDNVPISFLEWAGRHRSSDVKMAVAMNPITPKSILAMLVQNQNSQVSEAAQLHVNWSGEMNAGWDIAAQMAIESIGNELERNGDQEATLWNLKLVPEFLLPVLSGQVRLSVANNPETPIHLLEKLANDHDESILDAIIKNPNVTENILKIIINKSDENKQKEVILHPIFPWSAFQAYQTQLNVVEDLNATPEILLSIKDSPFNIIRSGLACHPQVPIQILEDWSNTEDWELRANVAANLSSSEKILERLVIDKDWIVRWGLVQNLSTPITVLEKMTQDEEPIIRDAATENLEHFSKTGSRRSDIIFRPAFIPRKRHEAFDIKRMQYIANLISLVRQSYLQTLSISNLSEVRYTARLGAWSTEIYLVPPNISILILEQLANSQEASDYRQAAQHFRTPVHLLESLATHYDNLTRSHVARNMSTPINVLLKLLEDTDNIVKEAAIEGLMRHMSNPDISDELLVKLTSFQDWRIQLMVARHPKSSSPILKKLSQSKDWQIRMAVAQNLHTSADSLAHLQKDENMQVRQTASQSLGNPILPATDSAETCNGVSANNVSIDLEKYCKSSTPSLSRLIVFLHPLAPVERLAKNVRSLCWLERYAIAQNPNTPASTLKILSKDGNRVVRATAKATLGQHSNLLPTS